MGDVLLTAEQLRRPAPGGIGTYVRSLARSLGALADDLLMPAVTLYASRPSRGTDPIGALGLPLRTSALPARLLSRGWDGGIADVPTGYGVVHATSLLTPPCRHAALVVTIHDLAWRHTPESYPARGVGWHERALRRAVQRAAAFVVPSRPVGDEVTAAGAPSQAVHVIEHGSDHLPAPDDAGADALLERAGVKSDFILSVGTLEPRKNLPRLVEAYALARHRLDASLPLVIVGPRGWEGRNASAAGASVATAPGVVLAGSVSGAVLAALYRRSRLLAYVPLIEGFGLPPLEAMAQGIPVVASPMPGAGRSAFEVDPFDVDAIADALEVVASDATVRARLVADGLAWAAQHTWAASARAHVRLWETLR